MILFYCEISMKIYSLMGVVLHALGRQRQVELWECGLRSKFQASQSYMRLCIKAKQQGFIAL